MVLTCRSPCTHRLTGATVAMELGLGNYFTDYKSPVGVFKVCILIIIIFIVILIIVILIIIVLIIIVLIIIVLIIIVLIIIIIIKY